ncbi:transcription antitermination factor NusB [Balneolaceae bacterium YR4-1]|uniref:Transcription antitermination protein NusB n=1 Tax=Halalkalibaculum roseum TaxID=2709311 RepID=A0A6M1SN94_9BACT|nr:transcription antitermination factor NusB [Halalkalibaculum roseum]NGP76529.1 transcription antitermination factor NusB [Halalkalibaculum roseum]
MTHRREIRETVLQALYAEELSRDSWEHILKVIIKPGLKSEKDALKFAENLFLRTLNHQEEIDEIIQKHIKNWKIERLTTIDKLILRIALCEFLYFEQIPTKVTINEALEIAKKYSTSKSSNFVNGILDAALEELREADRINKKGRGLIESSIN